MAEYIEREAAIIGLAASGLMPHQIDDAAEALQLVPAADVVPVRHGRWIVSRIDYSWLGTEYPTHCKCDQCGREIPYLDMDDYCPNCGARMDGDGD